MAEALSTVFYDSHCGLCHRWVKFLLAHDPLGKEFDFAPLQGDYCAATIPTSLRSALPDSVVVRALDGNLLVKSAAVLYLLGRIGGAWSVIAKIIGILPRRWLDLGYDYVARIRRGVLPPPPAACPLLPSNFEKRFHR